MPSLSFAIGLISSQTFRTLQGMKIIATQEELSILRLDPQSDLEAKERAQSV